MWEVDDDGDGAVSWAELRAAAARAWADGGSGGSGGGGSSAGPSPSPLSAAAGRAPRRLVDVARFLARADPATGRLAVAAAAEDEHLRTGRAGLAELMEVGGRASERETPARPPARARARARSPSFPRTSFIFFRAALSLLPLSSQDLGPSAVASGSLSLTEFLAAQTVMQTRCLRAGPAAVSAGVGGGAAAGGGASPAGGGGRGGRRGGRPPVAPPARRGVAA